MRTLLTAVFAVLLSLVFNLAVTSQAQAQQSKSGVALRGRVVDAGTGEPIAKVKIIVSGSSQSTSTDEQATHYNLSLERTLGNRIRVRAEIYDREDANLLFSLSEPRVEGGLLNFAELPFRNALHGHARGIELTLQRRSANGLTGWVSYSYSKTRLRDDRNNLSFVSDFDQRHTFNVYSSYRVTETFNLNGLWRYGSGFPIPGFFRLNGPTLFLASDRNLVRLPNYQRLDARASKAFLFEKWKLTQTGEVLNVMNRDNFRYAGFDDFRANGAVIGALDKQLPRLPSVGVVLEF